MKEFQNQEELSQEDLEENRKMKNNLKQALDEFLNERRPSRPKKKQILKGNYRRDRDL